MKIGFVTAVRLGLGCMEEIQDCGGGLELAITLRDDLQRDKSGRVYLDEFCDRHAIDLVKTRQVNDPPVLAAVAEHEIDWLFIIGWSQIAKPPLLGTPRKGVLGMHPTLLPEGRGRAAIPWAILKGLRETGVTLFKLDEGVDTGPILAQRRIPMALDETATALYDKVTLAHRQLIRGCLPDLAAERIKPIPQDESKATEWPGRRPADGKITSDMTVSYVDRLVRATTHPYPGAFVELEGGVLRVWRGVVGDPRTPPPPGAHRLVLSDGVYDALDHEWEGPPAH
jgi:methionyl-tRNA formyltransferase